MTATVTEVTRRLKEKEKERKTPHMAKERAKYGTCGAKRKGGGRCTLAKGWGTDHPGLGYCKYHLGATRVGKSKAAKDAAEVLFGHPVDINPLDALLLCVNIRAGEVYWLTDKIQQLEENAWTEQTIAGKQLHIWARQRHMAMQDLANFAKIAVGLGIAERQVKLAEQYGEAMMRIMHGVRSAPELALTQAQQDELPNVFRRELLKQSASAQLRELGHGT